MEFVLEVILLFALLLINVMLLEPVTQQVVSAQIQQIDLMDSVVVI